MSTPEEIAAYVTSLKVVELRDELKKRQLSYVGNKPTLAQRLRDEMIKQLEASNAAEEEPEEEEEEEAEEEEEQEEEPEEEQQEEEPEEEQQEQQQQEELQETPQEEEAEEAEAPETAENGGEQEEAAGGDMAGMEEQEEMAAEEAREEDNMADSAEDINGEVVTEVREEEEKSLEQEDKPEERMEAEEAEGTKDKSENEGEGEGEGAEAMQTTEGSAAAAAEEENKAGDGDNKAEGEGEGDDEYEVVDDTDTNNKGLREIRALAVWCNNLSQGCSWQGTASTLEGHVVKCDYAQVSCPNGCIGDDRKLLWILKKDLDDHLCVCPEREHHCTDCGLVGTYRAIVGEHDLECTKKVVVCPNEECCVSLERGMVEEHVLKSCEYTVVECKYASIGCEAKIVQRNREKHEKNIEVHFEIALERIAELVQQKLKQREPPPPPTPPTPPPAVQSEFPTTFRLTGYAHKKRTNSVHYFVPFLTHPLGYTLSLYLHANGQGSGKGSHLSVYLKVMNGLFDFNLTWPLTGVFTIELLNQLADANHCKRTLTFNKEDQCQPGSYGWGYSKFISFRSLNYNPSKEIHYLKDDRLFLRVTCSSTSNKSWLNFTHE